MMHWESRWSRWSRWMLRCSNVQDCHFITLQCMKMKLHEAKYSTSAVQVQSWNWNRCRPETSFTLHCNPFWCNLDGDKKNICRPTFSFSYWHITLHDTSLPSSVPQPKAIGALWLAVKACRGLASTWWELTISQLIRRRSLEVTDQSAGSSLRYQVPVLPGPSPIVHIGKLLPTDRVDNNYRLS